MSFNNPSWQQTACHCCATLSCATRSRLNLRLVGGASPCRSRDCASQLWCVGRHGTFLGSFRQKARECDCYRGHYREVPDLNAALKWLEWTQARHHGDTQVPLLRDGSTRPRLRPHPWPTLQTETGSCWGRKPAAREENLRGETRFVGQRGRRSSTSTAGRGAVPGHPPGRRRAADFRSVASNRPFHAGVGAGRRRQQHCAHHMPFSRIEPQGECPQHGRPLPAKPKLRMASAGLGHLFGSGDKIGLDTVSGHQRVYGQKHSRHMADGCPPWLGTWTPRCPRNGVDPASRCINKRPCPRGSTKITKHPTLNKHSPLEKPPQSSSPVQHGVQAQRQLHHE